MGSMIIVLIYIFVIYIAVMFLYSIYKVIWYSFKLSALRKTFSKLANNGVTTVRNLKVSQLIFGKKGETCAVLKKGDTTYEISVLSFISTHSRWNIEKTRNHYYVEVRKKNKAFYNLFNHSENNSADIAREIQNESRFKKCMLHISEAKPDEQTERFLLIYPKPKNLTYTHTNIKLLDPGDRIEGYKIMYVDDLNQELAQ